MDVSALLAGARQLDAGCTEGQVALHRRGDGVFVLVLRGAPGANPENRWTLPFARAVHRAFDALEAELEADPKGAPAALLTVSGSPKFFSNGIDPGWAKDPATPRDELLEWDDLTMPAFARPVLLPIPTVCAIGGHAFGAGLMFALGHDFRLQRTGRGFLCAIEVEIGFNTPRAEFTLFRHSMPANAFYETILHAKRWGAADAAAAGIVQAAVPEDKFYEEAAAVAARHAKLGANRECMGYTKREVKGHVAHDILKFTFPNGKQKGPSQLPAGLQRHVQNVVMQGAWDSTWAVTQSGVSGEAVKFMKAHVSKL